jgi:hypothetical protein
MRTEASEKEEAEFNAHGKPIRLKAPAGGPDIKVIVDGAKRLIPAGTVFVLGQPKRARQLIELGLAHETTEPTAEEKAKSAAEDEVATDLVMAEMRARAGKIVAERKEKRAKFEAVIRKMNAETLDAELEKRGLKNVLPNTEAKVSTIVADELAKVSE